MRLASALVLLLTGCASSPTDDPLPMGVRPPNVTVKNEAHREVRLDFDERAMTMDIRLDVGVRAGTEMRLAAAPGEYRILVAGRATVETFRVPETRTVSVVIRGARTDYLDVVTAAVEDGRAARTVIVYSEGTK